MESLEPRPSLEQLQTYYEGYGTTKMSDEEFRFLFTHSLEYFKRFFKKNGLSNGNARNLKYLDVGFGHGASLVAAAVLGCEAYGLDLDAEAISSVQERAKQYGTLVRCFHGDVNALNADLSFDLIKASQVIEHTLDPVEFLKGLFLRQPAGGQLMIECPNNEAAFWYVKNILRKRYDRLNFYKSLKLSEHLSGFTKTSISLILNKVGYEVIQFDDYAVRDPRFHHENLLWYPTVSEGLRRSVRVRDSYHFLKSLIPVFDSLASRVAGSGTHMAVLARKVPGFEGD